MQCSVRVPCSQHDVSVAVSYPVTYFCFVCAVHVVFCAGGIPWSGNQSCLVVKSGEGSN